MDAPGEDRGENQGHSEHHAVAQSLRPAYKTNGGLSQYDYTSIVATIEELKSQNAAREEGESIVPATFTKHVTLGNVFAVAAAIGSGFAVYYGIKDDLKSLHRDSEDNKAAIHEIVSDRDKYRSKYLPMIEDQSIVNNRQDNNMQSMRDSIVQLRDSVSDLAKMSRETHEDMAVMKNIIQGRTYAPHN